MTERSPYSITGIIEAVYPKLPRRDYSISELLIMAVNDLTIALVLKFISLFQPKAVRSNTDADMIYKHIVSNVLQMISASFILLCALLAIIFPAISIARGEEFNAETAGKASKSLFDFYVFYSTNVFNDTSTFTTLSIGVIAGSISIASLGRASRSRSEDNTRFVQYSDLLGRFAFVYNALFILFYASQLIIWTGGFLWQDGICNEQRRIGPDGMAYYVVEKCGSPSPIIAVTSILTIFVCGVIHGLTIQSRYQSNIQCDYAYTQLLETADRIKLHVTPQRRLPVWNVIHLYTALSLLIVLFFAFPLELTLPNNSHINLTRLIISVYVMSLFLALIRYKLYPYLINEHSPRKWIPALRIFFQIYTSFSFTISIVGSLPESTSTVQLFLLLGGIFTAFNLPLAINFIPEIKTRLHQTQLNEVFRLFRIKARRVEKYQILARID